MKAKLRVCASCEWIFNKGVECPKCQFGSYGAHYVYGAKAYSYKYTQQPWLEKQIDKCYTKLNKEIRYTNTFKRGDRKLCLNFIN